MEQEKKLDSGVKPAFIPAPASRRIPEKDTPQHGIVILKRKLKKDGRSS